MLSLLYATGLRVSELVGLPVEALRLDAGFVLARGKGNKERLVPVGSRALEAVRVYLQQARGALLRGRTARALFVTHRGRGFTRQGFWKLLGRYALGRGIRKPRLAAQAAPFVRHAPGGAGGGPARGAGHAGPRGPRHHADLHARGWARLTGGLRRAHPRAGAVRERPPVR